MTSILIDTSCFIEFLRGEDSETVPALILAGKVILSSVVKLELLAEVRKSELLTLDELLSGLAQLEDFPPVDLTQKLLTRARGRGSFGGISDLMILSDCARTGSHLLSSDTKMVKLAQELKIKLWND